MIIAALILSILSLVVSLVCLVWMLAKHFSTHQIQLVPSDNYAPLAKPMTDEFQELGAELPDDKIFKF